MVIPTGLQRSMIQTRAQSGWTGALTGSMLLTAFASAAMPLVPMDADHLFSVSTTTNPSAQDLLNTNQPDVFLPGRNEGFEAIDIAADFPDHDLPVNSASLDSTPTDPMHAPEISGRRIGTEVRPEPDLDLPGYIRFLHGEGTLPTQGPAAKHPAEITQDPFCRTIRDLPLTEQCYPRRRTATKSPDTPNPPLESAFDLTEALRHYALQNNDSHLASFSRLRAMARAQARADREPGRTRVIWTDTNGDGIMEKELVTASLRPGVSVTVVERNEPPETSNGKPNYPGLGERPKCVVTRSCVITRSEAINRPW